MSANPRDKLLEPHTQKQLFLSQAHLRIHLSVYQALQSQNGWHRKLLSTFRVPRTRTLLLMLPNLKGFTLALSCLPHLPHPEADHSL